MLPVHDYRNDPSAAFAIVALPIALVCFAVLGLSQTIGAAFSVTLTFVVWAVFAVVLAGVAVFMSGALSLPIGAAVSFIWWKGCAVLDSIACGACSPSSDPWRTASRGYESLGGFGGLPSMSAYGSSAWYVSGWFQWGVFIALVAATAALAVWESNERRYY